MELVFQLLRVALAAALTENLVFARAVGWGELEHRVFARRRLPATALTVAALSTVAAFSGWLGKYLMEELYPVAVHLRPPVYLAVYAALVFLFLLVWYKTPALRERRLFLHPSLAFGFIPLSVMLVVGAGAYGLAECLVYGLAAGLGYLAAVLLTISMKTFMELRRVPEAMRGAPIALLYFGLVSLALFGVLGHQLAI